MSNWLARWDGQGADTAAVLVTVAAVQGSVPRAPGAKMLVFAASQSGTVGGGHLEMRALEIARAMLSSGGVASLERFALGPSLGQCCGGAVHLAFEPLDQHMRAQLSLLQQRLGHNQDSWRCIAIDGPPSAWLFDGDGGSIDSTIDAKVDATLDASASNSAGQGAPPAFLPQLPTRIVQAGGGRRWLIDPCLAPRNHLMLFGAGHVGTALIRALAAIDCRVTWVDQRADQFPVSVPSNVTIEISDAPDMLAAQAAPGTSFLVMTHSHALDLLLCEAILRRPDAPWFGLIGSITKRSQFERRLQERGLAPQRIAAMVCPIGLPGITGKEPAVIAASVCCQLLLQWQ